MSASSRQSESPLFEIELPERRAASLGGTRPRATLVITTQERGEERLFLPVSVGRALKAKQDSLQNLSGRAELLYHVRELSARQAALRIERLVDKRDYSTHELDEKLRQDGFGTSVREAALSRAVECGLVNDRRYAEVFIRSKLASGWGQRKVEQELRRRGIEASELEGWPEEFMEGTSEDERALELARTRRIAQTRAYEKLVRYLMGRGFSMSCSMRAARRALDEADLDQ